MSKVKHFLSIGDLSPENFREVCKKALTVSQRAEAGERPLKGKFVGIYFRGTSTRTRTAFTVGAHRLGAEVINYGPNDLQINTGETVFDTGRVLSGFLDMLVIRTNDTLAEMTALAEQNRMLVINAMSQNEHPTQAIGDLVTIHEAFGHLDGIHVLYIGEGNNTAAALALAMAQAPGMRLTVVTPSGYGLPPSVLEKANRLSTRTRSVIEQHHRIDRLPRCVDVVYTTRWQTMGVPKADADWLPKFAPYKITAALMATVSNPSRTIFLHDLPAIRGLEVENEVLDGPQSLAFRQAQHKLTGAMAILEWCAVN